MEKELGEGNKKPEILSKLAQYELTLLDWVEAHKGSRKYVAIAGNAGQHSRHNLALFLAMLIHVLQLWEYLYPVRLIYTEL